MEKNTYIYIFGEDACNYYDNNADEFKGKNSGEILAKFQELDIDGAVLEYEFNDNEKRIYEQAIEDCDGWFDHVALRNNY